MCMHAFTYQISLVSSAIKNPVPYCKITSLEYWQLNLENMHFERL